MNLLLLSYMFVVFVSYLTYVVSKFGVLPSISDSYYLMKSKIPFTLFIWSIAIPTILVGDTALMFFAGSFLAFVGAAPAFREEQEGIVHVVGAIGGITLGVVSMWVDFHLWYLSILLISFAVLAQIFKKKFKNHTWWVEIASFTILFIGMAISKL